MSKQFFTRNQGFLYFNDTSANVQKRSTGKTIQVIDPKALPDVVDSPKKKEKVPTVRDVLNDFFESTSVHGLQYFGKIDIKVGFFGKVFWTCTILTGFVCAQSFLYGRDGHNKIHGIKVYNILGLSLMVMQFLHRYNDNPTNTYIKSFYSPILEAPFPAVTICSFSPIPLHRRLAILDGAMLPQNMSREHALTIFKFGHYITLPYAVKKHEEMDMLKLILKENQWSLTDFLKILRPCDDIVETCWWNSEHIDCSETVKISYTSYGLCCSFNYLLEEFVGRDKDQPKPIPVTSANYGRRSGLKILIKKSIFQVEDNNSNEFSKSITNSDGMLVLVHHSMDYPGLNTNSYILQKGRELQIAVKPELIKKPAGLYHQNRYNEIVPVCIPNDKNPLKYMPIYRYSNCYANCRVRAMIKLCGCLPFIYDQVADFYHVDHCDVDGLACIQANSKKISIVRDVYNGNFTCSCRTPCEDVVYEGSLNSFNLMKTEKSPSYTNVSRDSAILRVYMCSQVYQITETRPAANEFYLLASIGGIFSLFLGCSFLSLVEIIYFGGLVCRAIIIGRRSESPKKPTTADNIMDIQPSFY